MKSAWLTLLKIAVAVALAVYVISQIKVEDALLCEPDAPDAEAVWTYGDLEGDWQGDDWVFRPDDGSPEVRPAELPEGCELRPGFFTILAGIRLPWVLVTVALWTFLVVIVGWRWQLLLRAAGVTTSYLHAMRLCFIGYFFNNVMPGQTGGDLVRAVLVARSLESRRANAAMSVLIDRILGLFSLLLLAAVALVVGGWRDRPDIPERMGTVAAGVFLIIAAVVVGGGLYLSRRFRRLVGLEALISKLPEKNFIRKIDAAITLYRHHLPTVFVALGMSLVLQCAAITSFWSMSESLGAGVALSDCFVIFPVVMTISAVPVAPAGWGVGETLFGVFFKWFGSSFTLGVAVSILFRLITQLGFGLIGGIVWVLSREHKQGLQLNEEQ